MGTFASGGGLSGPIGDVFGPDGNLYVASYQNWQVLEYNGVTGAFIRSFASFNFFPHALVFGPDGNLDVSIGGGLSHIEERDGGTGAYIATLGEIGNVNPVGLVFGSDDNLYVSLGQSYPYVNRVDRWNGTTLDHMDNFVGEGSGGLIAPEGILFGPDGNLYVSSHLTDQILRYNGQTGSFIDIFASGGGLSGPTFLTFGNTNPTTLQYGSSVPEPSAVALLVAGTLGLLGCGLRRWLAIRTGKTAASEQDAPAIRKR